MIASGGATPSHTLVFYDRIKFDGTAYIETDITPSENASFRVNLGNETLKAAQRYFGCACTSGSIVVILSSATTNTTRTLNVYYGQSGASGSTTIGFSTDSFFFFLTPHKFGYASNSYNVSAGAGVPNGNLILGYNSTKSGQAYTGTMGIFRVYGSDAQNATSQGDLFNNYTAEYTLKPCTYDGEAGMWCEELNKFYGNSAGSGTLTVYNLT